MLPRVFVVLHSGESPPPALPNSSQPSAAADARGQALFERDQIHSTCIDVLTAAHPDLPGYILTHYASLVADPEGEIPEGSYRFGPSRTALAASAAVRAMGGAEELVPFFAALVEAAKREGLEPLGNNASILWIIESVDRIVDLFQDEDIEPSESSLLSN